MQYLAVLLFVASLGCAEIIDRIALTIDKRAVTESEILRQIRVTAFLNNQEPDLSAANRRATADRLVEQLLIRRELEGSGYTIAPEASAANYAQVKQRFKTAEEYAQALARYQIRDADIRKALEWQATLLEFVDVRFRPGVQIPPSEIREYYDAQVAQSPGKLPPFDDAKADIEQILTSQRVDNALDRWLGQARTQTRIRYMQEVFR
jgi:hypothetical protein